MKKNDPISLLIEEGRSYVTLDHLKSLIEKDQNFSYLPVQPLYLLLRDSSPREVAEYLPLLSKQQREFCLDLDLWHKDELDVASFQFWFETYAQTDDEDLPQLFLGLFSFCRVFVVSASLIDLEQIIANQFPLVFCETA